MRRCDLWYGEGTEAGGKEADGSSKAKYSKTDNIQAAASVDTDEGDGDEPSALEFTAPTIRATAAAVGGASAAFEAIVRRLGVSSVPQRAVCCPRAIFPEEYMPTTTHAGDVAIPPTRFRIGIPQAPAASRRHSTCSVEVGHH